MNKRIKTARRLEQQLRRKLVERQRRAETMARLIDPEPRHAYMQPPSRTTRSYTVYGGPCQQCGRWMQDPVHS